VALAAGLRAVLSEEATAERLRQSGAERADRFSMDRLARRYVDLYTELHHSELGRRMAERVQCRRGRRRNIPST
jgi:hypothetical protein